MVVTGHNVQEVLYSERHLLLNYSHLAQWHSVGMDKTVRFSGTRTQNLFDPGVKEPGGGLALSQYSEWTQLTQIWTFLTP